MQGKSYEEYLECAMSCWRYIQDIFTQLDEFWAFELLRSGLDRTRYLCVKEAKVDIHAQIRAGQDQIPLC